MLKIILFTFAGIFLFFLGGVLLEINSKIISAAFNKIRPMFIEHGGEKCLNQLRTKGVKFVSLGENAGKEKTSKAKIAPKNPVKNFEAFKTILLAVNICSPLFHQKIFLYSSGQPTFQP